MILSLSAYVLLLLIAVLMGYGVMYIVRCVRRRETCASVGMALLSLCSLGMLVLLWIHL